MAHNHGKEIEYIGDSRVPAKKVPNIPRDFSEYPGKTEPFFPNFLLKEWMVGALVLIGFLILTLEHPSPLGATPADPTNASGFIPVPDWYFLFLYQFLKYDFVSGPFIVMGIIVLPGLAFGGLLLAPFLDTGKERRPSKRPIAVTSMLTALACVIFLTWAAVEEHHKALEANPPHAAPAPAPSEDELPAIVEPESDGAKIYAQQSCVNCHGAELEGGAAAPTLRGVGNKHSEEEIAKIMTEGFGQMPAGMFKGSDEEKQVLATWLSKQK